MEQWKDLIYKEVMDYESSHNAAAPPGPLANANVEQPNAVSAAAPRRWVVDGWVGEWLVGWLVGWFGGWVGGWVVVGWLVGWMGE